MDIKEAFVLSVLVESLYQKRNIPVAVKVIEPQTGAAAAHQMARQSLESRDSDPSDS